MINRFLKGLERSVEEHHSVRPIQKAMNHLLIKKGHCQELILINYWKLKKFT